MIDTHCHLTDPRLGSQLGGVLARAAAAGVRRMITIGTAWPTTTRPSRCAGRGTSCGARSASIPTTRTKWTWRNCPRLRQIQADPSVVALGEMGLDYFHAFAPRPRQFEVFEFQLNLAAEVNRPVVIHCREAIDDCLAVMKDFPAVRAVFHCFTGSPDEARKILDRGYLLGFTGAATFKKNDALREAVRLTPIGPTGRGDRRAVPDARADAQAEDQRAGAGRSRRREWWRGKRA